MFAGEYPVAHRDCVADGIARFNSIFGHSEPVLHKESRGYVNCGDFVHGCWIKDTVPCIQVINRSTQHSVSCKHVPQPCLCLSSHPMSHTAVVPPDTPCQLITFFSFPVLLCATLCALPCRSADTCAWREVKNPTLPLSPYHHDHARAYQICILWRIANRTMWFNSRATNTHKTDYFGSDDIEVTRTHTPS